MESKPAIAIFTVKSGAVQNGAQIVRRNGKTVLEVGEDGRGRKLATLLVENAPMVPCPKRTAWGGKPVSSTWPWDYEPDPARRASCGECGERYVPVRNEGGKVTAMQHPDRGEILGRLYAATLLKNSAGMYKLVAASAATNASRALVVMPTPIGFRGSNEHTGDRTGRLVSCPHAGAVGGFPEKPDGTCEECGVRSEYATLREHPELRDAAARIWGANDKGIWWHPQTMIVATDFLEFPGNIIAKGWIAQGAAGYAGSGQQIIATVPKNAVFRTGYSGRLYGAPAAHYYVFTGETVLASTWEDRLNGMAPAPLEWGFGDWS